MFFDGDDYYERRRHHRDALERGKRNRETHRETENVQNVSREGKIRRHRRVDGVEGDFTGGSSWSVGREEEEDDTSEVLVVCDGEVEDFPGRRELR